MLGDGHLERRKLTHNTRLRIDQSYPEKKEYVKNLFEIFKPMLGLKHPILLTRHNTKRNTTNQSLYFATLSLPCLNSYHHLFYEKKVKKVPTNLKQLLTPRGLAY